MSHSLVPLLYVPTDGVAKTNVVPAGSASCTMTFSAGLARAGSGGVGFDTVIV